VEVKHALAGVRSLIDHESISTTGKAELLGNLPGRHEHLPQRLGVLRLDLVDPRDVKLRDHEGMHRGHGTDVLEGQHVGVVEDDLRGGLAENDVAEEAAGHGGRA